MPLPSVTKGALQCQVKCKRTGIRCKNPAAFSCKSCRMHGAHRSRKALRGADHPNYKNGGETKEARAERSSTSAKLLYIRDIGDHIGMFTGTQTRGRKPTGYCKLDLNTNLGLNLALLKTSE
jgi:hypothetical protein